MSRSHIALNHLLRQVEEYKDRKHQRDIRPAWLTGFINDIAELFEPLEGLGRVGFDCRFVDEGWHIDMYLGAVEVIGGPDDGRALHVNFQLDLNQLAGCLDQVERFEWIAIPLPEPSIPEDELPYLPSPSAMVLIEGQVKDNAVCLRVSSVPPEDSGPAFRMDPRGNRTAV